MGQKELFKLSEQHKYQEKQLTREEQQEQFRQTFQEIGEIYREGKEKIALDDTFSNEEKKQMTAAGTMHKHGAKKKIRQERKFQIDQAKMRAIQGNGIAEQHTKTLENIIVVLQSHKRYKGKSESIKKLKETHQYVGDVECLLTEKIDLESLQQAGYMNAKINLLMMRMGQGEKLLRETVETIQASKLDANTRYIAVAEVEKLAEKFAENYSTYKKSIPQLIGQKRQTASANGQGLSMEELLKEVNEEVLGEKLVFRDENLAGVAEGGGVSEVTKLEREGKLYFFKEQTYSFNAFEVARNYVEKTMSGAGKGELLRCLEKGIPANVLRDPTRIRAEQFDQIYGTVLEKLYNIQRNASGNDKLDGMIKNDKDWWTHYIDGLISTVFKANEASYFEIDGLDLGRGEDMMARNLGAERMAELMGIQKQLVHSREAFLETTVPMTKIDENGKIEKIDKKVKRKGFVMDQASGVDGDTLMRIAVNGNMEIHYTPEAMQQMMNLMVLDQITAQLDRHQNNIFFQYSIEEKEKGNKILKVTGVSGIDNDEAFARKLMPQIKNEDFKHGRTYLLYQELKDGQQVWSYGLEHMDRKMYDTVMSLTPELIDVAMREFLEPEALEMLKSRTKLFQDAVNRKMQEVGKNNFLIEQWTEELKPDIEDTRIQTSWLWLEKFAKKNALNRKAEQEKAEAEKRKALEQAQQEAMKKAQEVAKAG